MVLTISSKILINVLFFIFYITIHNIKTKIVALIIIYSCLTLMAICSWFSFKTYKANTHIRAIRKSMIKMVKL